MNPRFEMRLSEGVYRVFLVKRDNVPIATSEQPVIFTSRQLARAQTVSDALNNGMAMRIVLALTGERRTA